jgi:hypothetical protein
VSSKQKDTKPTVSSIPIQATVKSTTAVSSDIKSAHASKAVDEKTSKSVAASKKSDVVDENAYVEYNTSEAPTVTTVIVSERVADDWLAPHSATPARSSNVHPETKRVIVKLR